MTYARRAHTPQLAHLDHAEKLCLGADEKLAHLVQVHHATVGSLKEPHPCRAGSGPARAVVSEEVGIQVAFRKRGAATHDKGPVFAIPELVCGAGQELTPASLLAEDENREPAARGALQNPDQLRDPRILGDDSKAEAIGICALRNQIRASASNDRPRRRGLEIDTQHLLDALHPTLEVHRHREAARFPELVACGAALLGISPRELRLAAPDKDARQLVHRLDLAQELGAFASRAQRALPIPQHLMRHRHDAAGGSLFETVVDPSRDAETPLARNERAIRLADANVHLGDPTAELGDQVAFRRKLFGDQKRLIVELDRGLVVELIERDVPQVLQCDDMLTFKAVLLRLRERATDMRFRVAQVPSDAELLPEAKSRLHPAAGVPALAEKGTRAGKLLVRLLETAKLRQGDAQIEREVRFLVVEPGASCLELAAAELRHGTLDLAGAQEAEAEEVAAPEHPLEVFEIPPADMIRGAEMFLRSRRPSDPPHRPARRDVVFKDRLLVVWTKRV